MNAVERLANGYEGSIRHLKAEVTLREGQLRDFQGRVGREFVHERYASQLADMRDELRRGLSDGASEEARGKVAELAERIREARRELERVIPVRQPPAKCRGCGMREGCGQRSS